MRPLISSISLVLLFGLVTVAVGAELIPGSRTVPWIPGVTVGVPGGIPSRTVIHRTILSTSDDTDRAPEISAAIASCPAGQVVKLGAGTFRIKQMIYFGYSNVTLRGSGPSTILEYAFNGTPCIRLGLDTDWPWDTFGQPITGDPTKGTSTLTMTETSRFSVNQLIRVTQDGDPALPELHVGMASTNPRLRYQTTRVVSKTPNSISIQPALYWDLKSGRNPHAHAIVGNVANSGIEDMTIDATNSTGPRIIDMWATFGCWISNVHSIKASNYHVYMIMAVQCEMRHSFADSLKNRGSNGAALLMERSSANLIEDNIFYAAFPHIEVNFGSSGNVFAYNLCELNDVYSSMMGASIEANHGPHNSFNLYEGNVASMFQADGYFGSSSEDTLFRNRFHGSNDNGTGSSNRDNSKSVDLGRFTRKYNIVGNILGMPQTYWSQQNYTIAYERHDQFGYDKPTVFRLGYPNIGNNGFNGTVQPTLGTTWQSFGLNAGTGGYQEKDLDVAATLIRKGNWNGADLAIPPTESLGGESLPASLYRSTKPAWFGTLSWPSFDPASPSNVITVRSAMLALPAGYRFLNQGNEAPGVYSADAQVAPSSVAIRRQ